VAIPADPVSFVTSLLPDDVLIPKLQRSHFICPNYIG